MEKRWLGVTISVPIDYYEGISNFLFELGATGIEEIGESLGRQRFRAYFTQDRREKKILRAIYHYIKSLESFDPKLSPIEIETVSIPEKDWAEDWRRFFKPIRLFSKFLIKPPWARVRIKTGEIPINILPAMAFGTGSHPTTQLCIRALETIVRKNISVLDLGIGSGILAIISARLGAKVVLGLDKDEVSIENAIRNVSENGLSNIIRIKKGSIGNVKRMFDVIVANIDFKTLKRLCHPIKKRVNKKGFLILSGILEEEMKELCRYYLNRDGFKLFRVLKKGEWICIILKRL